MNVLFFQDSIGVGGGEIWIADAADRLQKNGHKISIGCPAGSWMEMQAEARGYSYFDYVHDPSFEHNLRWQLVEHLRQHGQIPQGVSVGISGAGDQLDATRQALAGNYVVAIVIIYLLLVAIFTNWGYPLLIMTSIPLGVACGLVGLALMNWVGAILPYIGVSPILQPFDMISMLGFLILMGTVVNNPILIVDRALYNVRQMGANAEDAVMEAVSARLRPIAMSTVTTICGLAPLVFIPGAGTELYRGVGAIVLFGILGTAIVTLTFLPALTLVVLRAAGYVAADSRMETSPAVAGE